MPAFLHTGQLVGINGATGAGVLSPSSQQCVTCSSILSTSPATGACTNVAGGARLSQTLTTRNPTTPPTVAEALAVAGNLAANRDCRFLWNEDAPFYTTTNIFTLKPAQAVECSFPDAFLEVSLSFDLATLRALDDRWALLFGVQSPAGPGRGCGRWVGTGWRCV